MMLKQLINQPLQVGQLIIYCTPNKVLPIAFFFKTYQASKNREIIMWVQSLLYATRKSFR